MASLSALALAACAVGPDYVAPVPPAASSGPFIAADTPAVSTDPVAENWWRLYDDPVLDGLVEDALTANTDLRVAIANIACARAGLKAARAEDRQSTRLKSRHQGATRMQTSACTNN